MSNFLPTVGRNVQYISAGEIIFAGVISFINNDGTVDLTTFSKSGVTYIEHVPPYVDTFDGRKLHQPNTYLLNWQGR